MCHKAPNESAGGSRGLSDEQEMYGHFINRLFKVEDLGVKSERSPLGASNSSASYSVSIL